MFNGEAVARIPESSQMRAWPGQQERAARQVTDDVSHRLGLTLTLEWTDELDAALPSLADVEELLLFADLVEMVGK